MEVYYYYFYLIAMGEEKKMCTGMAGAVMEQQVAMILNCNVSENDQFDLACYILEKGSYARKRSNKAIQIYIVHAWNTLLHK